MKSTAILDLMVKDHARLITLLQKVEQSLDQDIVTLMKTFDTFEWELEKHIFTEEKAIFTSYDPVDVSKGYAMVPELIKEHNEITNKLRVMRKELIKQHPCDFDEFKKLLMNHKTFEENTVYPKLDQELDETQKKTIVDRISQIVS
jgi:iron-sulfur cluster repair protein YtfE (RIC family)